MSNTKLRSGLYCVPVSRESFSGVIYLASSGTLSTPIDPPTEHPTFRRSSSSPLPPSLSLFVGFVYSSAHHQTTLHCCTVGPFRKSIEEQALFFYRFSEDAYTFFFPSGFIVVVSSFCLGVITSANDQSTLHLNDPSESRVKNKLCSSLDFLKMRSSFSGNLVSVSLESFSKLVKGAFL